MAMLASLCEPGLPNGAVIDVSLVALSTPLVKDIITKARLNMNNIDAVLACTASRVAAFRAEAVAYNASHAGTSGM